MLPVLLESDTRALAELAVQWLARPGGDPLREDTLVVGQPATGYWLQHRIARRIGISAHLRIERPVGFIWRELAEQLPGTSTVAPFDPLRVRWAVHGALGEAAARRAGGRDSDGSPPAGLALLLERWRQASATERVRLATGLAMRFEAYQSWRRDWTESWARGRRVGLGASGGDDHEPWQRWLWQQVLARLRGHTPEHPFDTLRRRQAGVDEGAPAQLDLFGLPSPAAADGAGRGRQGGAADTRGRVLLFGPLGLSADQLEALARLARSRPMLWLMIDPAIGYWQEMITPARAARLARDAPDTGLEPETEPALLGQWGRQTRDALEMLRAAEGRGLVEVGDADLRARTPPAPGEAPVNRLHLLQRAILALEDAGWTDANALAARADASDASLEIHVCHGLARQADAVYDRLMDAFRAIPDLCADEVAVLCVDVDAAEPWLRARFSAQAERSMPLAITGLSARADPVPRAVLDLLAMICGEISAAAVVDWLDAGWARRRFGLGDEDIRALRNALEAAGWGVDDLDAPVAHRAGWRLARARLALGDCHEPADLDPGQPGLALGGTWPVAGPGDDGRHVLGLAFALIDEVTDFRGQRAEHAPGHWWQRVEALASRWFSDDAALLAGLGRFRAAGAQLLEQTSAAGLDSMDFETFVAGLRGTLEQGARLAWPQGAITVAPLGSLRGVPYRVVAVMGLDDGAWPVRAPAAEFDLMRAAPRHADPAPGDAARAVMLDLVRDTSERLLLAYTGRDARDNGERPPSRVVGELLDYLARVDPLATSVPCVHVHALQPFSPTRFTAPWVSYDRAWAQAARRLFEGGAPRGLAPLLAARRAPEVPAGPASTTLDALIDAMARPQRHFLRTVLGVRLPVAEAEIDPAQALDDGDLGYGDADRIATMVLEARRAGAGRAELEAALAAHPLAPPGVAFETFLQRRVTEADSRLAAERECLLRLGVPADPAARRPSAAVRLILPGWRMVGAAPARWGGASAGEVAIETGRPAANAIVAAWCRYLFWVATSREGDPPSWLLVEPDGKEGLSVIGWGPAAGRLRGNDRAAGAENPTISPSRAAESLAAVSRAMVSPREPLAFARLASDWVEGGGGPEPDDDRKRQGLVRNRWLGDGSGHVPGFVNRPDVRAIWRDAPPGLSSVLAASLAGYAPLILAARGEMSPGEALSRWRAAWELPQ